MEEQDYLPSPSKATKTILIEKDADPIALDRFQVWSSGRVTLCNTGYLSIWGLDVIQTNDDSYLICIGGSVDHSQTMTKKHAAKNAIQIWRMRTEEESMKLIACYYGEFGNIYDLVWRPAIPEIENNVYHLAIGCSDGMAKILVVNPEHMQGEDVQYINAHEYIWSSQELDTLPWRVTWGSQKYLVAGCTDGYIALWDVSTLVASPNLLSSIPTEPCLFVPLHHTVINQIRWGPPQFKLDCFLSCGKDGQVLVTHVDDPFLPLEIYKTRGFSDACCWSQSSQGLCFSDSDSIVRLVGFQTGLDRSNTFPTTSIAFHNTSVWDMMCLPDSPVIVSGAADGSVRVASITGAGKKRRKPLTFRTLYTLRAKEDDDRNSNQEEPNHEPRDEEQATQESDGATLYFSGISSEQIASTKSNSGQIPFYRDLGAQKVYANSNFLIVGFGNGLIRIDSLNL